jgi:hypothetical protein
MAFLFKILLVFCKIEVIPLVIKKNAIFCRKMQKSRKIVIMYI